MADEKKTTMGLSRRDLVLGGSLLPVAFASFLNSQNSRVLQVYAAEPPKRLLGTDPISPKSEECMELGRHIFGPKLIKVSAFRAKANPFYGDGQGLSPSSLHAMEAVIETLGLGDRVEPMQELAVPPEGLLMAFGGPYNNPYTRAILGTGSGSPLLRLLRSATGILPVMFDIDIPLAPSLGKEPPWRVLINGLHRHFSDDCLVITSLPNPFSSAGRTDDRIAIIAARYRAGMMAVERVLTDAALLHRILVRIRGLVAWQVLIPVQTSDQITPRGLGAVEIFEVEADFDALHRLLGGKPFLGDPRMAEQYALLGSAAAVTQQEQLGGKRVPSDNIEQGSLKEMMPTRSDAMRGSGEGARTVSPLEQEMTMRGEENNPDSTSVASIIRRRREELSKLREVVDAKWAREQSVTSSQLALASKYALTPDQLSGEEIEQVERLLATNPKLKADVDELAKQRRFVTRSTSHSD